jgi:GNAT superfamily N-acetyltransferase
MSMRDAILPSLQLVQRVLAVDVAYTISRMQVLERIPGNPLGIAYRRIDEGAVALMSRVLPVFARVVGLRAEHAPHIAPLVSWYREHNVKPKFEIVPGMYDDSMGRELARLGFFQSSFHAALIGAPDLAASLTCEADIERVEDASAMERYLAAYVAGWGIPAKDHVQFKANVRPWFEQPGWSLYLARARRVPAAAATLFLHEGVGYLADAATNPLFRGQGLQSALLRRRIRDASTAEVDVICSGATPFSTSHRNMERVGMRVQFVRSVWTPL